MGEFGQKFADRQEGLDPRDGLLTPDDFEILARTDPERARQLAEEAALDSLDEEGDW